MAGGTPTPDEANWGGGVAWATPVDLGRADAGHISDTHRTLTDRGLATGSKSVPAGSLILSTRAPIGYVAQTDRMMAFNQGCRGLVLADTVDPRFLKYQLWAARAELQALGTGSTFLELSTEALLSYVVHHPKLAAQQRIADFLDDQVARIDEVARLRAEQAEAVNERAAMDAQIVLGRHAARWTPLKWLASKIGSGKTPRGGAEVYLPSGVTFLRSQNVHFDGLRLSDAVFIGEEVDAMMRETRVRTEDVLLNITGASIGRATYVAEPIRANVNRLITDEGVGVPGASVRG